MNPKYYNLYNYIYIYIYMEASKDRLTAEKQERKTYI